MRISGTEEVLPIMAHNFAELPSDAQPLLPLPVYCFIGGLKIGINELRSVLTSLLICPMTFENTPWSIMATVFVDSITNSLQISMQLVMNWFVDTVCEAHDLP